MFATFGLTLFYCRIRTDFGSDQWLPGRSTESLQVFLIAEISFDQR